MARIEVDLPTRLDNQIGQLVDDEKFLNRQEAVEELLTTGLQTYQTDVDIEEEGDLSFAEEMTNPGDRPMGPGEEDSDDDYL
jgi:metal-responsive CopG/Arc/MetJ family transcriptional regulator